MMMVNIRTNGCLYSFTKRYPLKRDALIPSVQLSS